MCVCFVYSGVVVSVVVVVVVAAALAVQMAEATRVFGAVVSIAMKV